MPGIDEKRLSTARQTESSAAEGGDSLRRVLLDGHVLGLECQSLALWEFMAADFPECYLETQSGTLYGLFRQSDGLAVAVAREHTGQESRVQTAAIPSDVFLYAVLTVGKPFDLGLGSTPTLARITVVTRTEFLSHEPSAEEARRIADARTGGNVSEVRLRFMERAGV